MPRIARYFTRAALLGLLGLAAGWAVLKRFTKQSVNQNDILSQLQLGDRGHESGVARPSSSLETILSS